MERSRWWCKIFYVSHVHPRIARYSRVLQGTKPQSIQRQAKRIKMDEIEWKWIQWMKVDENGWKWKKVDEDGWTWTKVDESGWKWIKWTKMNENRWKWIKWIKWMKAEESSRKYPRCYMHLWCRFFIKVPPALPPSAPHSDSDSDFCSSFWFWFLLLVLILISAPHSGGISLSQPLSSLPPP